MSNTCVYIYIYTDDDDDHHHHHHHHQSMSGEGLHEAPTSHMYRKRSSASHTCHQTRPGLNGVIGRLRNILLRIPANCLSPRMHVATFRSTFTHFLCINISGKTCVHIMCIDIILRTKSGKTKNEAIPIQSYSWVRVYPVFMVI